MIDFNKLIDQYLHREMRPKRIGRYYPSEIGYCLRKVWFSYKYPKETEKDLIKIFHLGNLVHDFVVNVLKSEKNPEVELLEAEMPFKINTNEFTISGRIDDLILVKENNKKFLVEVKSTRSIDAITEPSPTHIFQLQLYMDALNIHDGIVLYIEKNNLQSKGFEVKYEESKAKEAMKRFNILHQCLVSNVVPEPEARKNKKMNWMCRYCEYRDRCDFIEESKKNMISKPQITENRDVSPEKTNNQKMSKAKKHGSEKLKTLDMF